MLAEEKTHTGRYQPTARDLYLYIRAAGGTTLDDCIFLDWLSTLMYLGEPVALGSNPINLEGSLPDRLQGTLAFPLLVALEAGWL